MACHQTRNEKLKRSYTHTRRWFYLQILKHYEHSPFHSTYSPLNKTLPKYWILWIIFRQIPQSMSTWSIPDLNLSQTWSIVEILTLLKILLIVFALKNVFNTHSWKPYERSHTLVWGLVSEPIVNVLLRRI